MSVLLISDLHLQESEPGLTRLFHHFISTIAPGADALYVLGDLFEAWVGDDDDSPFHRDITAAFQRFSAAGHALYFLHGNRDFLLGETFAARCGGTLLTGPTVHTLCGMPTRLSHGDELCTDDHAYQAFRTQVRDPNWRSAFLAKPLPERKAIAAQMRAASKQQSGEKSSAIMDVNADSVRAVLTETGVRRLIHGHTHRPAFHHLGPDGERIVLGDWHQRGNYLRLSDTETALCYFQAR